MYVYYCSVVIVLYYIILLYCFFVVSCLLSNTHTHTQTFTRNKSNSKKKHTENKEIFSADFCSSRVTDEPYVWGEERGKETHKKNEIGERKVDCCCAMKKGFGIRTDGPSPLHIWCIWQHTTREHDKEEEGPGKKRERGGVEEGAAILYRKALVLSTA